MMVLQGTMVPQGKAPVAWKVPLAGMTVPTEVVSDLLPPYRRFEGR
jgi:hypothetical protein